MKEIAQLGWELMNKVIDAKRNEKLRKTLLYCLVKGITANHKELIKASLYRYLKEVNSKVKPERVLKEIYSFLPIHDSKAACVVVKDIFSSYSIPLQTESRNEIQKTYQQLEKKIREEMIRWLFGSLATEKDVEVAEENLKKAILKSQSPNDPQLLQAIRTYVFVKLNRELQRPDLNVQPDKTIEKFAYGMLQKALVEHVFEKASKIYKELAYAGQEKECVKLIASLLDFVGKDPRRAPIVNKIISKHLFLKGKVDLLEKCIELG